MIVKAKVIDTYEIMMKCDKCGRILRPNGFDSQTIMHKYVCDCGNEYQSKLCYPFTQVSYDIGSMQTITEEEVMKNA